MNNRGESLFLPDDIAIQRAKKLDYNKGWNDRKILNESVMLDALRENAAYRKFAGNIRQESSEAGEKIE